MSSLKKNFNVEIGRRIKEKRLSLGYTREKLANMAKISDKFLYDIEVGNKAISAKTLYKLKEALGVSSDWLLDAYTGGGVRRNGDKLSVRLRSFIKFDSQVI